MTPIRAQPNGLHPSRLDPRPAASSPTSRTDPGLTRNRPDIVTPREVTPMRRQPRQPRPPGWVIHSTFVPRRDGPRRLEQAFEILLGSPTHDRLNTSFQNRSEPDESGHLRPGLDREAGA